MGVPDGGGGVHVVDAGAAVTTGALTVSVNACPLPPTRRELGKPRTRAHAFWADTNGHGTHAQRDAATLRTLAMAPQLGVCAKRKLPNA